MWESEHNRTENMIFISLFLKETKNSGYNTQTLSDLFEVSSWTGKRWFDEIKLNQHVSGNNSASVGGNLLSSIRFLKICYYYYSRKINGLTSGSRAYIYLYLLPVHFCISTWRDSDIKHGLINDLLNTGTDLGPGAGIGIELLMLMVSRVWSEIKDQIPIFIGASPC